MIEDSLKRDIVKRFEKFLDSPPALEDGFEFKVYDRAAFVFQWVVKDPVAVEVRP